LFDTHTGHNFILKDFVVWYTLLNMDLKTCQGWQLSMGLFVVLEKQGWGVGKYIVYIFIL
jgi:hypothetical protein